MNTLNKLLALSVFAAASATDAGGGHSAERTETGVARIAATAPSAGAIIITWLPLARACQGLSLQRQPRPCRPLK